MSDFLDGIPDDLRERISAKMDEAPTLKLDPKPGEGEADELPGLLVGVPLTPAEWDTRELAAPDNLMGELFSTTSRVMVAADTGLGKSMLLLGLLLAMRLGRDFLHWKAKRPARVLLLDGEMPADLLQERIRLACGWFDVSPSSITDGLFILSRDDVEDMPPLDSGEGHDWLVKVIEKRFGMLDFIGFDNCMCLTTGDLREEMTWRTLIPFSRLLSRRKIGQLWLHHTGHDKSRAYGSRIFPWNMDAVGNGEAIPDTAADVSFRLSWEKKRRRTPANRADFATVDLRLAGNVWTARPHEMTQPLKAKIRPLGSNEKVVLDCLDASIVDHGSIAREAGAISSDIPARAVVVHRTKLEATAARYMPEREAFRRNEAITRALTSLQSKGLVKHADNWLWRPSHDIA